MSMFKQPLRSTLCMTALVCGLGTCGLGWPSAVAQIPIYPTERIIKLSSTLDGQASAAQQAGDREQAEHLRRVIRVLNRFTQRNGIDANGIISCNPDTPGKYVVSGVVTRSGDTLIDCPTVVFSAQSALRIRNGFGLLINAMSVLVEGKASIDAIGDDGARGDPGDSIQGEWHSRGDPDYWAAVNDCRSNPRHPDRGKQGRPGRDGRNGSVVILRVAPDKPNLLNVETGAGRAGPGGPGGTGRLLRNGRNYYCDGCTTNCPSGDVGPSGKTGDAGAYLLLQ